MKSDYGPAAVRNLQVIDCLLKSGITLEIIGSVCTILSIFHSLFSTWGSDPLLVHLISNQLRVFAHRSTTKWVIVKTVVSTLAFVGK